MTASPRLTVVTDANILINLIHVGRLGLCASLPGHELVIPEHVRDEIRDTRQRGILEESLKLGELRVEPITDLCSLALYAAMTGYLGRGESACLALAIEHDWMVASDEKGRFRREALHRLGEERLMGTKELYLQMIRFDLLSVDESDADKALLEERRFKMDFKSFRDLVT